jgi:hypothetical protein
MGGYESDALTIRPLVGGYIAIFFKELELPSFALTIYLPTRGRY